MSNSRKHAKMIKEGADDVSLFAQRLEGENWLDTEQPLWVDSTLYRFKPQKIKVGNQEIERPEQKPPEQSMRYYLPNLTDPCYVANSHIWNDTALDVSYLSRGLVHLTAAAAIMLKH